VAKPGAEFETREIVEVDLAGSGHAQKVVRGGPQNVQSLDVARIEVIVLHRFSPFAVGFLEDAG